MENKWHASETGKISNDSYVMAIWLFVEESLQSGMVKKTASDDLMFVHQSNQ